MALWNPSWSNISTQFGMPLFGIGGLLPFTGNYFWVDQTNGSDGNTGGPQDPFKTLSRAHDACLAGNNDVVLATGTFHVTSTLTWSKDRTHLIGLAPSLDSEARARISQTGSTVFSPLVNVTADECIFMNIGSFHGFNNASAQVCWLEQGQRNKYSHCAFLGMGHATAGAQAGGRSLVIDGLAGTGNGEHTFDHCTIGLDTVVRAAANASLEFLNGTPRNVFRNCLFPCFASAGTPLIVKALTGALDRYALFDNCQILNAVESSGTALAVAFSVAADAGGACVLTPTTISLGCTTIATAGPVYFVGVNPGGANSASAGSLAIKHT